MYAYVYISHILHPGGSYFGSVADKGGMPETGPGTPRDKPIFYIFGGLQNIFFYRICEADPLSSL